MWWHRFLCFVGIRNKFDWAPPGLGPDVNHPYMQHPALQCCEHCGGGKYHAIHQKPYDERRTAEVLGLAHLGGRPQYPGLATPGTVRHLVHVGPHVMRSEQGVETCDASLCWCKSTDSRAAVPGHVWPLAANDPRLRAYIEREH